MTRIQLLSNQAHVWAQDIQTLDDKMLQMRMRCLSADEYKRAAQFVHLADTKRLIIAYSGLRLLLSKYLSVSADSFVFEKNNYGKPYLVNSPICFNLSHSKNWVIWAFALDNDLGIDIEYEREGVEILSLAERFFTKEEYTVLKNIPPRDQLSAFYRCWTRKEAFIKATGKGLSYPLNKFEMTLKKEVFDWKIRIKNESNCQKWYLYSLRMPEKYTAAIVLKKRIEKIQYNKCKI